ncbi:MAG: hypothetical protein ACRDFC_01675 [Ignavibacteria bacterium]
MVKLNSNSLIFKNVFAGSDSDDAIPEIAAKIDGITSASCSKRGFRNELTR